MTTHPLDIRSEKGIALIVVLLLLGVMAALTAGLSLNSQTEVAMSRNETFYAGARAAAEAGMNRAVNQILNDTTTDLLATGAIPNIGNGPFTLNSQYGYSFEILDDDDPSLYPFMTEEQLDAALVKMGEDGDPATDLNTRMILRSIGTGPNNTTVIVSRVLQSTEIPDLPETTTLISNPAILVNGDLDLIGTSFSVQGLRGNVHANGNITGNTTNISGDVTATGTVDPRIDPGGLAAGNQPGIAIPDIKAADYLNLADYILKSDGTVLKVSDGTTVAPATLNWSWDASSGTWRAAGSSPVSATYYAETAIYIKGTGGNPPVTMSVIAEGSITIEGNGKFSPENGAGIQFVTNGDFDLGGTATVEDTTVDFDGQIMAREQLKMTGSTKFQGRVMAQNIDSALNAYDPVTNPTGLRKGVSTLASNSVGGSMTVTYNGHLGDIVTEITTPAGASTYTNNISGWLEQ